MELKQLHEALNYSPLKYFILPFNNTKQIIPTIKNAIDGIVIIHTARDIATAYIIP